MKKTLSLLIVGFLFCTFFSFSAFAEDPINEPDSGTIVDIEYLDNGDYIVTYLDDGEIYGDGNDKSTTVTKTKTKKYLNSAGDTMWAIRVQGTFTYNGTTCTCTKAAHKATSYASTWTIISASHSKSGNHATATATARHQGSTGYQDYTRSVTLTCSPTGVFS